MNKFSGVQFRKTKNIAIIKGYKEESLKIGCPVVVETDRGIEYGTLVCICPEKGKRTIADIKLRKVLRYANEDDISQEKKISAKEEESLKLVRQKLKEYDVRIKIIDAEYLFDESRFFLYYRMIDSKTPVNLKDFVKDVSACLKIKVEMHQVSPRDEAKFISGIGPCGRTLCCTQFLEEFPHVTVKILKEQGISISPMKTSGICGKLMCCLKYEYEDHSGDNIEK